MLEWITQINNAVNGVVWGPAGLALLFGTGLIMSVRTGFFQFRKMGYWLRHTIGAIFTNKDVTAHTSKEDMAISQFQSMCTALAGTIGTGNIVGVATAIVSGGPGAIFWMWVMALLGMMTSFSENVLGVYYRRKNEKGEWSGGAMYYLTDGLGAKKGCKQLGKVLAVLFACFCILASFGIGNMSQLNSIAGNMNAAFGVPTIVTGLALMVVTALIVIGGLKRVAAVTEKLVPLMALFYIAGALIIVVMHAGNIPAAFGAIFKGAFNLQAAGGGALGYGISQTITWGFKRGAFSNEAGLGSAVMVNSASNVKEPVHQGMWGVFEVFADTIVVCTLTALVILTTGVVDLQSGAVLANVQDNALVGQERSPGNSDAGFLKNSFIAFTAGIAAAVDITVHPARTGEHDARLSDGRRVRIRRISILIRIPAAIEMINFAVDNIDIDGTDGTASPSPSIDAIYRCVFNRDRGLFGKSACAIPTAINPCVTVRFSQIDTVYIDLHILDGNLGARGKVVADSRTVNFHTSGISIRGWIKYASSNIHHDIAHGSRPTIKGTARTPDINAAMYLGIFVIRQIHCKERICIAISNKISHIPQITRRIDFLSLCKTFYLACKTQIFLKQIKIIRFLSIY